MEMSVFFQYLNKNVHFFNQTFLEEDLISYRAPEIVQPTAFFNK